MVFKWGIIKLNSNHPDSFTNHFTKKLEIQLKRMTVQPVTCSIHLMYVEEMIDRAARQKPMTLFLSFPVRNTDLCVECMRIIN